MLLFAPEAHGIRWVVKGATTATFPEGFYVTSGPVTDYSGSIGIIHLIALWFRKYCFTVLYITDPVTDQFSVMDLT